MEKIIEKLYNQLDWKQKEQLNILSFEYIRLKKVRDRPSPISLIRLVMNTNISYNYSDDFVEKNQLKLLDREITIYRNENI